MSAGTRQRNKSAGSAVQSCHNSSFALTCPSCLYYSTLKVVGQVGLLALTGSIRKKRRSSKFRFPTSSPAGLFCRCSQLAGKLRAMTSTTSTQIDDRQCESSNVDGQESGVSSCLFWPSVRTLIQTNLELVSAGTRTLPMNYACYQTTSYMDKRMKRRTLKTL